MNLLYYLLFSLIVVSMACNEKPVESTKLISEPTTQIENENPEKQKMTSSKEWSKLNIDGVSLDYPSDWRLDEATGKKASFIIYSNTRDAENNFQNNINLVVQNAPAELTLDRWEALLEKGNSAKANYKRTKSKMKRLKGLEIKDLEYGYSREGFDIKHKQYLIIKNNKAYNLTYTATKDTYFKDVFKVIKMFNSIEIE